MATSEPEIYVTPPDRGVEVRDKKQAMSCNTAVAVRRFSSTADGTCLSLFSLDMWTSVLRNDAMALASRERAITLCSIRK